MEKIKRENSLYHYNPPVTSTLNMPAPPLLSPSMYSGPPPPYSYPSSAASSTIGGERGGSGTGHGSYISPPETRRTSEDDKEPIAPQRQSLPSITEALNGDQQSMSISSLLASNPPSQKRSLITQSPTSPITRTHFMDSLPKGPPTSFPQHNTSSYISQDPLDRTSRPLFSPSIAVTMGENRFPAVNSISSLRSYDHHPPIQPPRNVPSPSAYGRPGASPIQHKQPGSPPRDRNALTNPPSSNTPNSYNAYQPAAYSYPPTTPGVPSYRTPTLQQPTWHSSSQQDRERADEIRKAVSKESPPPTKPAYGESVKRHLDIFDIESSLNEVSVHHHLY